MKQFRTMVALSLSILLPVDSLRAGMVSPSETSPSFSFSIPHSLGYISETYRPATKTASAGTPDVILIQDLHVNRSVQRAISAILKRLKIQGLMEETVAVEGETGVVEVPTLAGYPNAAARREAADYLVSQGEMPGAMHFVVTEGEGRLFGIETDEYYQANLDMFRRSYKGRMALKQEIEKIQAVLSTLKKQSATQAKAMILEKELRAVSQLVTNQVIPSELLPTLRQATQAVEHLKHVLPQDAATPWLEPLSASINFYTLALLRNDELFKNAMAARRLGHQKTTIVVTGGFHTQALAESCKRQGLSYAVITPQVKRHNKTDQRLYIERLMDHHLTPEQAASGQDWAAMQMLATGYRYGSQLFDAPYRFFSNDRQKLWRRRGVAPLILAMACGLGAASCGGESSPTAPSAPSNPSVSNPSTAELPIQGTFIAISQSQGDASWANVNLTFQAGDIIRVVYPASAAGARVLVRTLPEGGNATQSIGLNRTPQTVPAAQSGYSQADIRLPVESFGLALGQPISQISLHSGPGLKFNVVDLGPANSIVIPVRFELLRTGITSTPQVPVGTPFADEFDGISGSRPGASWTYDIGGPWGNQELEKDTDSTDNVFLNGAGQLVIRAIKTASGGYTSGRIKTQGRMTARYGRVEARIKVPAGAGFWPAFWLLGEDFNGSNWPQTGEIDVMENSGRQPNLIYSGVHGPGYSGSGGLIRTMSGGAFSDDFHVYAVDWTPDRLAFSVDGTVYHSVTPASLPPGTRWVFNDKGFFIILNLAVGGNFPGSPDASTRFPADMVVDYVRVTPITPSLAPQGIAPEPNPSQSDFNSDRSRNTIGPIAGVKGVKSGSTSVSLVTWSRVALAAAGLAVLGSVSGATELTPVAHSAGFGASTDVAGVLTLGLMAFGMALVQRFRNRRATRERVEKGLREWSQALQATTASAQNLFASAAERISDGLVRRSVIDKNRALATLAMNA